MRAMRAEGFGGYQDLKPVDVDRPVPREALRHLTEELPLGRVVLTI